MSSITYIATDYGVSIESIVRHGTEQTLDVVVSEYSLVNKSTRTHKTSMDNRHLRGTYIARHSEFEVTLTFPSTRLWEFNECLHSLMDYQVAVFDLADVPQGRRFNFVLLGDSWSDARLGCKLLQRTFSGYILPGVVQ